MCLKLENNETLIRDIELKIDELFAYLEQNKAQILSETDLQCMLYAKLHEIELLAQVSQTRDGFLTNKIHTEISFYDDQRLLRYKPDICLMQPENLSVKNTPNGTALPSKGLSSTDGGIIFELKFDKQPNCINEKMIDNILKDINKFNTLLDRYANTQDTLFCFFVIVIKSQENSTINQRKLEQINRHIQTLPHGKYKSKIKFLGV